MTRTNFSLMRLFLLALSLGISISRADDPVTPGDEVPFMVSRGDDSLREIEMEEPIAKAKRNMKKMNEWTIRFTVRIYNHEDWNLVHENRYYPIKSNDVKIPLTFRLKEPLKEIVVHLIGPKGDPFREVFYLHRPDQPIQIGRSVKYPFNLKLSLSYLSYKDTAGYSFGSLALTPVFTYRTPILWDNLLFSFSGFITAVHLYSNKSYASDSRFVGLNFRVGYTLPWLKHPWRISIFPGWYYTTMLVSTNAYGFQHLQGPQIYPTVQYTRRNNSVIFGYLKFSPISNGPLKFLGLSSHEKAAGIGYSWRLRNKHDVSASFDLSHDILNVDAVTFKVLSASVGAGYTF